MALGKVLKRAQLNSKGRIWGEVDVNRPEKSKFLAMGEACVAVL